MTVTHERLHKIARKIANHRFKTLPYTSADDVYQAAYIGALVASRKPAFRADDPGSDRWLSLYALQKVSSQEQALNKATSGCPRSVVDRSGSSAEDQRSYSIPLSYSPVIRSQLLSWSEDHTDQRILLMKMDTDMTMVEIGKELGLSYKEAWRRFRRIRLWARRQDFMLSTYKDLTGKSYVTKSRSPRDTHKKHRAAEDSKPKRDESSAVDGST